MALIYSWILSTFLTSILIHAICSSLLLLPSRGQAQVIDVDRPVPLTEVHVLVGDRVELPCDVAHHPSAGPVAGTSHHQQYQQPSWGRTAAGFNRPEAMTALPPSAVHRPGVFATSTSAKNSVRPVGEVHPKFDNDKLKPKPEEGDEDTEEYKDESYYYGEWDQPQNDEPNTGPGGVSSAEDGAYLVLWFFDPDRKPIYSFDVRGRRVSAGRHWWDERRLGNRAFFLLGSSAVVGSGTTGTGLGTATVVGTGSTVSKPSRLQILNVTREDAGFYRCRVDYRDAPTRNVKYKLVIIDPPSALVILNASLRETVSVAGPLEEGADLILTCKAIGGNPQPWVSWWYGGQLIDNGTDGRSNEMVTNRLVFPRVGRHHLHDTFTCQASSSPFVAPSMKYVTLELLLRPLQVEVLSPVIPSSGVSRGSLVADQSQELRCRAIGSRPAAMITWWRGSRQIKQAKTTSTNEGNVTLSVLTFVPTAEDDGRHMTCRAENPHLLNSALEDSWKLDVQYPPVVRLAMGNNINPDDIKEGDDMYFECHIRANPAVHRLAWTHNGLPLWHNTSVGVVMSNVSLVLQGVTRARAGKYACVAANIRGEVASPPVHLRVQYAPRCQTDTQKPTGVARHESATLTCRMDADPSAEVHFWWTFLGSAPSVGSRNAQKDLSVLLKSGLGGETMLLPRAQFSMQGSTSTLTYTPRTDLEYGLVACWASNSVGNTREPCVFQIVPAGKPGVPQNCTVHNRSADSVRVDCVEAFDGGLEQHFGLDVLHPVTRALKTSLTSGQPWFVVQGLEPDSAFLLHVYAINSKGRSEEVALEGMTLRAPEKHIVSASTGMVSTFQMTPLLAILIGTAATLLIVVLTVAIVVHRKQKQRQRTEERSRMAAGDQTDLASVGTFTRPNSSGSSLSNPVENTKVNGRLPLNYQIHEPDILLGDLGTGSALRGLALSTAHERPAILRPHLGRPPDTSPDEDGWGPPTNRNTSQFYTLRPQQKPKAILTNPNGFLPSAAAATMTTMTTGTPHIRNMPTLPSESSL